MFWRQIRMACFLVPAGEAVITTIVAQIMKSHGRDSDELPLHVPFVRKLHWLSGMLWGGSALLAFEHVWHGEVAPRFPFLTAAANPADTAVMLREMRTVGTAMALLVTAVWGCAVAVAWVMEKKLRKELRAGVCAAAV